MKSEDLNSLYHLPHTWSSLLPLSRSSAALDLPVDAAVVVLLLAVAKLSHVLKGANNDKLDVRKRPRPWQGCGPTMAGIAKQHDRLRIYIKMTKKTSTHGNPDDDSEIWEISHYY